MKLTMTVSNTGRKHFFIDGEEVTEQAYYAASPDRFDELLAAAQAPGGHLPSCWPMKSDALAVHPKQIRAAMARNARYGVNVEYARDGRPILQDRGQRRELMKLEGVHDNEGGYGDDHGPSPQPLIPSSAGDSLIIDPAG
jgi:hypothetical protein